MLDLGYLVVSLPRGGEGGFVRARGWWGEKDSPRHHTPPLPPGQEGGRKGSRPGGRTDGCFQYKVARSVGECKGAGRLPHPLI